MTVTIDEMNDPPTGGNNPVTTLEDTAYVFDTSDFGFSDPLDTPPNTFLSVHFTTVPSAGSLTDDGTTVGAGDDVTAAHIAAGKLQYLPAEDGNGSPYRTFTFQVQDNGGTTGSGVDIDQSPNTMTINVTPVNDAPVGTDNTVSTAEDTAYVFDTADFGFSDPTDNSADSLLAVKITSLPASGSLKLNGSSVSAGDDIAASDIVASKLVFTPGLNGHGTGYADFMFKVQDDGGTANSGEDLATVANTMTIDVNSANDRPSGTDKTVNTNEDASYTFAASDFGFTDSNDSPPNTLLSVKIATLSGGGSLKNNGFAVVAGDEVDASDIGTGKLVFTPAPNANGSNYAGVTFQVRDNGGGSDLDLSANAMQIDVDSVNDAPAGADKTIGITENSNHAFVAGDFGFTDPNDNPDDAMSAVKITTLPATGSLRNHGSTFSAGTLISIADINGGFLVYTPTAGTHNSPYTTFTFQVQDNGGTANGGVNLDASANTITINVTPINHAPNGAPNTLTTPEDVVLTLAAADFGFTDVNDTPANTLLAVKVTTLASTGKLRYNNASDVTLNQFISKTDIDAGKLTFVPAANASGSPTFQFAVQDNGGVVSGGVDLDPTPALFTINVTSRNDAPSGADKTVTMSEEATGAVTPLTYTFLQADFGFSDPNDSGQGHTLTAVKITTLPAKGSLKDNGVAVIAGNSIPVADITGNKLTFTPALNGSGTPYTTFTFQVRDTGGTGNGGTDLDQSPNTISVNVTPVNDNPVAHTDTTLTVPENAGPTALAVLLNDTDADNDALVITSTTAAAHGVVTITGGGTGLTYDPTQLYFGTDTFKYTIGDGHGGAPSTATVLLTVVKDATPPTVVGPAESFYAQTVANTTSRVKISWSGSDAGTGLKKFELAVSVNGGGFVNLTLGSATATSLNITLTDEKSYKFRVRATDNAGNVSGWVNGPAFKPGRIQQNSTSVVYTGPWVTSTTSLALGGSHRFASSLAARAALTRTTRDFAVVMTKSSSSGLCEVRIDGVLVATINLFASTTSYRQLVYSKHFGTLGTHTIEVRPIGGTRIYLDAFLVMR